ncbi:FAD binding domain-containing protein [Dethiosulfovibrio salsuginis]|uniref:Uncharacterized protein n=1 Tax=Dethiosulfovibrio salsuginis TaxID=561720 RepID=A0A1X7JYI3_9BACT|nr:hypothetical protein [Dethiosulfovibrio salsuginis]SMG33461.1 hypothetical protein SAMN06275492_11836 [Dethiosulfovibrio salsuginis]
MNPQSLEDLFTLAGDWAGLPQDVSLEDVRCLQWISIKGDYLAIGPMVTWGRIRGSDLVQKLAPSLLELSQGFEQNRTLGEELLKPSPQGPGEKLISLGAKVELLSSGSSRETDLSFPLPIAEGELLRSVLIPLA